MKGIFVGNLISQDKYVSAKNGNVYYHAVFNDGIGDLRVEVEMPLEYPRFTECKLTVDVIQGKFPKFVLDNLVVNK
jgi:hypothetical protein